MKGKQLVILLGLGLALGGTGYYVQRENRSAWSESGGGTVGSKVLDLALNDVVRVTVKDAASEVNLVKQGDEWTVQERANYPASYEMISGLLTKVWDLKTVQEVKVGPSQFGRLDLLEPTKGAGTLLVFKGADDKSLGALVLGKKYVKKGNDSHTEFGDIGGFASGRYVVQSGGAKVSLISDALEEVKPQPEHWLKRDFVKIANVIGVSGGAGEQSWKLARENTTAEWKLEGAKAGEELDPSKANSLATALASASLTDVLGADAKPEQTGFDKPSELTFQTADQFTYALKVGKLNGESYPVSVAVSANLAKERTPGKDEKPEDKAKLDEAFKATQKSLEEKLAAEKKLEGRAYLIAKGMVEPLLKERKGLFVEKKPETPPGAGAPPAGAPISLPPGFPGLPGQ